jgi:leucyl aminopeptidase
MGSGARRMTVWRLRSAMAAEVDAVVVPVYQGEPPPALPAGFLAGSGFAGDVGAVLHLPTDTAGEPGTVLLGFGPRATVTTDTVRTAAGRLARAVRGYPRLALTAPNRDIAPLVEGYLLGGYRFDRYRSDNGMRAPQRIEVITPDPATAQQALDHGRRLAAAVALARDLVNEPGEALTPQAFADRATEVAAESGLDCEVWDADRIAAERLGGLLGVARGSLAPPRLVRLTYRPPAATRRIALVGKGVTFDAGGLSLKPNAQLADMKADMAGAAAVLGAMSALAGLNCPIAVDGWLPLTENMPNADPIRVGDVLRIRNGRTVEIRNADAEGRLILADALVLAGETGPDAIVDIATLTDAAAVALGRRIAAVMGTDNDLVDRIRTAAAQAGEPVWPLPLPDAYRPQLDSKIADLVNYTIGTRHGTALLAGLFLREFVPPTVPWAHLDIQGTAWSDMDDAEWTAGGSGFGVRTLARLALDGG